jgi:hypothetical protein
LLGRLQTAPCYEQGKFFILPVIIFPTIPVTVNFILPA